jgi:hypothetical protein
MSGDVKGRAREALTGITPGEWEVIYHQHDTSYPSDKCNVITALTGDLVAEVDDESRGYEEPHAEFGRDAYFIAAAPSLISDLLSLVEEQEAEIERLRGLGR